MTCPTATSWVAFSAGQLPPAESSALRAHALCCPRCKGELAFASALSSQAAAATVDVDGLSARVMQATAKRPGVSRPAVLALAAVLVAMVSGGLAREFWSSELTARGGASAHWQKRVAAELRPVTDVKAPVAVGQSVPAATRWALWYRNAETERPLYLLAYVVDAQGALHWLAPAYLVAGQEPSPIALPSAPAAQLLGEVVQFDATLGPATLVTVVSTVPGSILAFESSPEVASARPEEFLPGAVVWRRSVTLKE